MSSTDSISFGIGSISVMKIDSNKISIRFGTNRSRNIIEPISGLENRFVCSPTRADIRPVIVRVPVDGLPVLVANFFDGSVRLLQQILFEQIQDFFFWSASLICKDAIRIVDNSDYDIGGCFRHRCSDHRSRCCKRIRASPVQRVWSGRNPRLRSCPFF